MDGGEGLCRRVSEPARLDELRPEFGNIIQHKYPGDDHQDLMLAVDEVIKRGYIDEKKQDHRRIRRRCVDELGRNRPTVLRRRCLRGIFQTGPRGEYSADFTLWPAWFKEHRSKTRKGFEAGLQ